MTIEGAAERLGVSPKTVRQMIADGLLAAVPCGFLGSKSPRWRVTEQALRELSERFIAGREAIAVAAQQRRAAAKPKGPAVAATGRGTK